MTIWFVTLIRYAHVYYPGRDKVNIAPDDFFTGEGFEVKYDDFTLPIIWPL